MWLGEEIDKLFIFVVWWCVGGGWGFVDVVAVDGVWVVAGGCTFRQGFGALAIRRRDASMFSKSGF